MATTQTTVTQSGGVDGLVAGTSWGVTVLFSPDPSVQGLSLPLRSRITVGRLPASRVDLVIGDRQLSRIHATLSLAPTGALARVQDHDSKNGTFVDGTRAEGPLYAGPESLIRVGETLLLFHAIDLTPEPEDNEFGGSSAALRAVLRELDRVAPTDLAVLIQGESGAGKELAASRIHRYSGRSGALIAVNCATIPPTLAESTLFGHVRGAFTGATNDNPGLIAEAENGTLFLDEIGELPLEIQPKLLRVLEDHEYRRVGSPKAYRTNARIVSATLRDLSFEVAQGMFRIDLLARLQGFRVELPSLRRRRADILPLFFRFLRQAAPDRQFQTTADFAEALVRYDWPMNVRELRMVAERLALLHPHGTLFRKQHVPPQLLARRATVTTPLRSTDSITPVDRINPLLKDGAGAMGAQDELGLVGPRPAPSRAQLEELLRSHRGNVAQLASALNRDRKQIYRWLERFGLDPVSFRDGVDEG